MLLLSRDDVMAAITMRQCIDAVRQAYAGVAAGTAVVPPRPVIPVGSNYALFMPGYLPDSGGLGAKVVTVFPSNPARGLPTILGVVLVLSPETGEPLALMDGAFLTAFRTGAASGVSAELLARQGARVGACLGAGAQAPYQVEAIATARPLERVLLWNRTRARAEALKAQLTARFARISLPNVPVIEVVDTAEEAAQADIICCATGSHTPVLRGEWLRPGAHVSAVGAHARGEQEVDEAVLARAAVVACDSVEAALVPDDVRVPLEKGIVRKEKLVNAGDIALGRAAGRQSPDEITFFKSVGLAAQDIAAAQVVVAEARRRGLGQEVRLW